MTTATDRTKRLHDPQAIKAAFHLLVGDGNVTELRALDATTAGDRWAKTWAGYFDNADDLAKAAGTIKTAKGIYFIPNAVNPALLARASNRIKVAGKGGGSQDSDIIGRRWLLVDCDAIRPADISATDAEHDAARQRARDIYAHLQAQGWPEPIAADSGNGFHLLYRIDLPADDGGLVQRCLQALGQRFTDATVKVDESVFNPARIWKLYGTTAAKGDDVPDRPHRMAQLVKVPDDLQTVPGELLEALAAKVADAQPAKPAARESHHDGNGQFDVAEFIRRHSLDVDGPEDWNGKQGRGRRWTFKTSPLCEHHGDGPHIEQHGSGAITAGCHHESCKWTWHELRAKYEPKPNGVGSTHENDERERKSQSTLLVELAEAAELWHTQAHGDAYATIDVDGHGEHWPIRSKTFRRWLARQFYLEHRKAPGSQALQDALNVLDGKAMFEGETRNAFVRVAGQDGKLYLDLGDTGWRVVEIDAAGWRVVDTCPVPFRRAKAMLSLPIPRPGGDVRDLRRFVNVTDDDWPLLLGWVVAALRPVGPFPILTLHGEQGSAKTSTARAVRGIIDPNEAPVRCEPREPRDLAIAANNGWVVATDNLSHIPGWLSDALCRLATGGGFATRTLYENDEETIFNATRPTILTGIEEVATRSDLLDRCLILQLPRIPDDKRRDEAAFWADFNAALPGILGAVLDAVATAIRKRPTISIARLPRMADFALWATAAETGFGFTPGQFMAAYTENRDTANETALESSPVARYVLQLGQWEGRPGELLAKVDAMATDADRKLRSWPKTARSLTGTLRRLAPNLRAAGVEIEEGHTGRGRGKRRTIAIRTVRESCGPTDPTGPSPEEQGFSKSSGAGTGPQAASGAGTGPETDVDVNPYVVTVGPDGASGAGKIQPCSKAYDDGEWGEV
jgi:hypothetical protein